MFLLSSCQPDICDCLENVGEISVDGLGELLTGEEMQKENEACWEELNKHKASELIKLSRECRDKRKDSQEQ